jgi:hypothetical protein
LHPATKLHRANWLQGGYKKRGMTVFDFFFNKEKIDMQKNSIAPVVSHEEPYLSSANLGFLMGISRQAVDKMRNKHNITFEAVKVGSETAINKISLSESIETITFDRDKRFKQYQHLDWALKRLEQIKNDTDPVSAQTRLKRLIAQCKKLKLAK